MKDDRKKAAKRSSTGVKHALVGLGLMQGQSLAAAMRGAGYAHASCRNPTNNGVVAERCIEEARALFPETDPSYLRTLARRATALKLAQITADPVAMASTRLPDISRTLDVIEKYHGAAGGGDAGAEAREFVDRLELMQEIHAELRRRKDSVDVKVISEG